MALAAPRRRRVPRRSPARASSTSTRRRRADAAAVIEAMDRYYREYRASIHRGVYPLAAEATDAFEGARDADRRVRRLDRAARRSSPATRPRRSTSSRTAGAAATSAPATACVVTRDGAPLQLRAVADARRARSALSCRRDVDDEGVLDLDALDALLARGPKLRRGRARLQRARHDQPDRRDRAPRARRRRDRAWSTARRPCRTCRSTSPRSAPTSTPGPATRPTGRPASACCTGGASCSRRCRPLIGGGHMISKVDDDELQLGRAARASSRPARRRSPRPSASAPPSTGSTGIGMEHVRAHARDVTGYALERLRRGRRADAPRSARHRAAAARVVLVRARRRPPARRRRDPRPPTASASAPATTAPSR